MSLDVKEELRAEASSVVHIMYDTILLHCSNITSTLALVILHNTIIYAIESLVLLQAL